ncbi:MAG: TatD family hydrolase, partial [Candidatus Woesearchaeota archaeon]
MLVDVHCHLEDEQFDNDLKNVILRAKKANVAFALCNGLNRKGNEKILSLSERFDIVKCAMGLYPKEAEKFSEDQIVEQLEFIEKNKNKILSIGEIGLDFHYTKDKDLIQKQKFALEKALELAQKINLPVILHSRKAEQEVFDLLLTTSIKKAVFHCFTGKLSVAKKIADVGFYFSIPTNVVFSSSMQKLVEVIDLEQLLTETDAPYLSPFKGKRNEPAFVSEAVK